MLNVSRRSLLASVAGAAIVGGARSPRQFFMELTPEGARHIPHEQGGFPGFTQTIAYDVIYLNDSYMPREYTGFTPFYGKPQ